jgi:hypothetical protein
MSLEQAYQMAHRQQAAGRLDEARRIYERILELVPIHAEALTMLGSISYQQGDDTQADAYVDRAIETYQAVLARLPGSAAARAPLVNLLLARNRAAEAERQIIDLDLPVNPIRATPEEFARRRRSGMRRGLPPMLINTVPKSASESIWNRLAEGLGLAQCHLSLGLYPDCCLVPARVRMAAAGGLIAKEHLPATPFNLAVLAEHGLSRIVFHLRDPRQATLSWAHFVRDDVAMRLMAPLWRKIVPPLAVLRGDMPGLIDWCIETYLPLLMDFIRGWEAVSADPAQPIQVMFQSFELFRAEPRRYFDEVLAFCAVDPALFAIEAEAEIVHLRKGLVDEWRTVFSKDQAARAWRLIPDDLADGFGWTA